MPRQLTKRGHRLVFSNGIISLAVAAIVLLLVTDAKVDRLIPLYAIGVFTSFTLSQAGMAKHHLRLQGARLAVGPVRQRRPARSCRFVVARDRRDHEVHARGVGDHRARPDHGVACSCGSTASTRPRRDELEHDAPQAVAAPILRRHVVLVFVDHLDLAAARAIQYAAHADARRAARRPLRSRPHPHRGPHRGLDQPRPRTGLARDPRAARPTAEPRRARAGRRRARRPATPKSPC